MNNLFLSGKKDVGKTTILKSVFSTANIVPGGYTTFRLLDYQSSRPLLFQLKKAKFLFEDLQLAETVKLPENIKRAETYADDYSLFKRICSSNFGNKKHLELNKNSIFAKRLNPEEKFDVYPEVFDNYGVELLSSRENIIVIDELGRFELDAEKFKEKVFALLKSDKLVIGVIKAESNIFLNKIRIRKDVKTLETTKANRNKVYKNLLYIVRNHA